MPRVMQILTRFLYLKLRADDPRAMTGQVSDCIGLYYEGANTPDNNLVEGNLTSGTIGIYIWGSTTSRPSNNIIRKNLVGNASDSLGTRGITSEYATGSIIEGNTVQFQRQAAFPAYTLGINAYFNLNTIIRNNIVHSLSGSAGAQVIGILGSGDATEVGRGLQIYNNMIYNLQNTSTTGNGYMGGIDLWWNTDVLIAYNTVLLSGTGTNPIGTYALGYDVRGVQLHHTQQHPRESLPSDHWRSQHRAVDLRQRHIHQRLQRSVRRHIFCQQLCGDSQQ